MTKVATKKRRRFFRFSRPRFHGRAKMTLPVTILAGVSCPLIGAWNRRSNLAAAAGYLSASLTGYDSYNRTWAPKMLLEGAAPIAAGAAAHYVANMLGVNRFLSRAKIPLIRI